MPIVVRQLPDPSSAAWTPGGAPQARSESLDILQSSLERYLRGEISGRSLLISGHRGAGKTTLIDYSLRSTSVAGARPLRVPLYGPNLFPRATEAPKNGAEAPASANPKPGATAASDSLTDAQRVLMELTIGLYRSLVKEVAQSYEIAMSARSRRRRPARPFELAGRLVLDLDDAPGPDRLRRYWEMAGALRTGVLFRAQPFSLQSIDQVPADQGIREMVAVASAAQAFRVVAGKLDLSESKVETAENSSTRSSESKIDIKALLTAVLGLASGLFAAAGVYFVGVAATADSTTKQITGLGAALAAAVAAFTSARTATRTATRKVTSGRDYKFIRDFKLDTLGRELPNLIDRIRHAGLAPVFVVDELDKVPHLAENLRGLVQQLKPLVAERTFFCFLTDREYYEHLRAQSREIAYAPEHTYFTHRLFVSYAPQGLRSYLDSVLKVDENDPQQKRTLEIDVLATTYLLLYRARMHPFDLNAQLQRLAADQATGRRRSGEVRTDAGLSYAVTYQLAVETILRQEEVRKRIGQDPYLGQVIYDALYFPADRWDRNSIKFNLTLKTLRDHLATRIQLDLPPRADETDEQEPASEPDAPTNAKPKKRNAAKSDIALIKVEKLLSATDLEFIFNRLEEMIELLARPEQLLVSRLRTAGIDADIITLVRKDPLLTVEGHVCSFKFDAFGRPLEGLDQDRRDQLKRALPYVQQMNFEITTATKKLGEPLDLGAFADRFGILDTSPAWAAVDPAIKRVSAIIDDQARIEGDEAKDALAIVAYADKLEANATNVLLAIQCGRYVGKIANVPLAVGLDTIARLCNFRSKEPGAVRTALRALARDTLQIEIDSRALNPLRPDNGAQWDIQNIMQAPLVGPALELRESRNRVWDELRLRWEQRRFVRSLDDAPTRDELICAAAGFDLSAFFPSDIRSSTIANWTTLLNLGLRDKEESESDYFPLWIALIAASMLRLPAVGFNRSLVKSSLFEKRRKAQAEIETFERLDAIVQTFAPGTQSSAIGDFVVVVAPADSAARAWDVGSKTVGLVMTRETAATTIALCDPFMSPSPPSLRKTFLTEGIALNEFVSTNPPLRSLRILAGMRECRLAWSAVGQLKLDPDQPTPVIGTSSIDALNLTGDPDKPPPP